MQSDEGIALKAALTILSNIPGIKSYFNDSELELGSLECRLSKLESDHLAAEDHKRSEILGNILCNLSEINVIVNRDYLSGGRCGSASLLNYLLSTNTSLEEERRNPFFRQVLKNILVNVQKQIILCRSQPSSHHTNDLENLSPRDSFNSIKRTQDSSPLSSISSQNNNNPLRSRSPQTPPPASVSAKCNESRRRRERSSGTSPSPNFKRLKLLDKKPIIIEKLKGVLVREKKVILEPEAFVGEEEGEGGLGVDNIEVEEQVEAAVEVEGAEEIERVVEKVVLGENVKEVIGSPRMDDKSIRGAEVNGFKPIAAIQPVLAKELPINQKNVLIPPLLLPAPLPLPLPVPVPELQQRQVAIQIPSAILQEFNERQGFRRQRPNHIYGSNAITVGKRHICLGSYDDTYTIPGQTYSLFTSQANIKNLFNGSDLPAGMGVEEGKRFRLFKCRKEGLKKKEKPAWCYGGDYIFKNQKILNFTHFQIWNTLNLIQRESLKKICLNRIKSKWKFFNEWKFLNLIGPNQLLTEEEFEKQWKTNDNLIITYVELECVGFDLVEFEIFKENRRLNRYHKDCPEKEVNEAEGEIKGGGKGKGRKEYVEKEIVEFEGNRRGSRRNEKRVVYEEEESDEFEDWEEEEADE